MSEGTRHLQSAAAQTGSALPTPEAVRESYDRLHASRTFDSPASFYSFVLKALDVEPSHRLLDVGSGTGGFLSAASAVGVKVAGIDISPEAIGTAKKHIPDADLRVGSACELPWEDGSFDRVACLGTLEHLPDSILGAQEIGRVLTPDGIGFVYVPNTFYWRNVIRTARFGDGPDEGQIIQRHGARNEWKDLLETAGLEVVAVRTWRNPWEPAFWRPKAFVGTLIGQIVPENLLHAFGYVVRARRKAW